VTLLTSSCIGSSQPQAEGKTDRIVETGRFSLIGTADPDVFRKQHRFVRNWEIRGFAKERLSERATI
jgi:hypothetical protein